MNVPYVDTPALSPEHYKLVKAVEDARDEIVALNALAKQLTNIQERWNKSVVLGEALRYDLVLVLYCHSQRPLDVPAHLGSLFDLEWCLPHAINLAGAASSAKLGDRAIGYRLCEHIFTRQPHSLKLLLINSIRSDLEALPYSPKAEARWCLGLKAVASPNLATPELMPAVVERVFELFQSPASSSTRRLALAALENLASLPCSSSDTLANRISEAARSQLILSSSEIAEHPDSKRYASGGRAPEADPLLLSALVKTTAKAIGTGGDPELLSAYLDLLRRVAADEWNVPRYRHQGVKCGWLCASLLQAIVRAFVPNQSVETDARAAEAMTELLYALPDKPSSLADGIRISAFKILSTLHFTRQESLSIAGSAIQPVLRSALDSVAQRLRSKNSNDNLFSLLALRALPRDSWTNLTEENSGAWGEKAWTRIMAGLSDSDETIRRETMRLLNSVDANLVSLHADGLFDRLEAVSGDHGRQTPAEIHEKIALVSALLEVSSVIDADDGASWARRMVRLVRTGQRDQSAVLDQVVPDVVDKLGWCGRSQAQKFWEALLASGEWRENTTLAILLAASTGLVDCPEDTFCDAATNMLRWLGESEDGDMAEALTEPFLLAVLRGSAKVPFAGCKALEGHLRSAQRRVTFATEPIFDLVSRCWSDESARGALVRAARYRPSSTLPGFLQALNRELASAKSGRHDHENGSSTSSSSFDSGPANPITHSLQDDRPLRYEPYAQPVSPASTTVSLPLTTFRLTSEDKHRRLERELAKERRLRGGRGGVGQSVMLVGAGELALSLADKQALSDTSDTESEGSTPVQRSRLDDDRAGLSGQAHHARGSSTSAEDRSVDSEDQARVARKESQSPVAHPPEDLLFEVDQISLDPFHLDG